MIVPSRTRVAPAPCLRLVHPRHEAGDVEPRRPKERGRQVHQILDRVAHLARRRPARPAHEEGDAEQVFIVVDRLQRQPVLPQEVAMVRAEDYQRVVGQVQRIQFLQNAPDLLVHEAHHAVVARHVLPQFFHIAVVWMSPVNGLSPV